MFIIEIEILISDANHKTIKSTYNLSEIFVNILFLVLVILG